MLPLRGRQRHYVPGSRARSEYGSPRRFPCREFQCFCTLSVLGQSRVGRSIRPWSFCRERGAFVSRLQELPNMVRPEPFCPADDAIIRVFSEYVLKRSPAYPQKIRHLLHSHEALYPVPPLPAKWMMAAEGISSLLRQCADGPGCRRLPSTIIPLLREGLPGMPPVPHRGSPHRYG